MSRCARGSPFPPPSNHLGTTKGTEGFPLAQPLTRFEYIMPPIVSGLESPANYPQLWISGHTAKSTSFRLEGGV
uniref:Uncharacterized protein n=1 Tax=Mesocestoides corti TaxID=53468 RepID=A0A5K3FGU3_MESCO